MQIKPYQTEKVLLSVLYILCQKQTDTLTLYTGGKELQHIITAIPGGNSTFPDDL